MLIALEANLHREKSGSDSCQANQKLQIKYIENKICHFKEIDPLFAVSLGSEEDPFVINDEVPQQSPCSLCAKESYAGPVQTGQCCSPHG